MFIKLRDIQIPSSGIFDTITAHTSEEASGIMLSQIDVINGKTELDTIYLTVKEAKQLAEIIGGLS